MAEAIERYPSKKEYRQMPYTIRLDFEQKLGVNMPDGADYRSFGSKIGIKSHTLALWAEDAEKRGTKVMEVWIQKNGRAATIGALKILLEELDLIDPRDFLLEHMCDG